MHRVLYKISFDDKKVFQKLMTIIVQSSYLIFVNVSLPFCVKVWNDGTERNL